MPVVFASFFGMVIGGGSGSPSAAKANLSLVNEDRGDLAQVFIDELAAESIIIRKIEPEAKLPF